VLANHPPQLTKPVTGETRSDLGPYTHSTTEAAPSTPTSEETELSSSPAGQASGSTQTVANALVLCSVRWRKRKTSSTATRHRKTLLRVSNSRRSFRLRCGGPLVWVRTVIHNPVVVDSFAFLRPSQTRSKYE